MPYPLSIQLYSVRKALETDYNGVIRRIADMGYAGVETAGMFGTGLKDAVKLYTDLGLKVSSAHIRMDMPVNEMVDTMAALGCKQLVIPFIPAEKFQTADQIKANCEQLNKINQSIRGHGLTLSYHNHWWEFGDVGGRRAFDLLLEGLEPTVNIEPDTYWIKTAGVDPAEVVRALGSRAPLLHIKDGPAVKGQPMTAVGDGVVDVPAIIGAASKSTDWLVVELDDCATDMLQAVQKSYQYLTSKGLGRGRSK